MTGPAGPSSRPPPDPFPVPRWIGRIGDRSPRRRRWVGFPPDSARAASTIPALQLRSVSAADGFSHANGKPSMTTEKDRPGETIPLEQTEAFEIAAMKDPGIARVELAQSGVTPIEVHRPAAGQTLNITVVAGRPLKIDFNAADVKAREVVKDDLVLEFDDGGKIVLKECMTAFGMLGEVRTTIIQPDGKHYAFTELLSPTAGPRTADRAAPGTSGDVVIIQKPHADDTEHFKLTDQKPMVLNFGFGE